MDPGIGVSNIEVDDPSYLFSDAFVAKYNSSGNHIWSYGFGNDGVETSTGITSDDSAIYVTGTHHLYIDMDPGPDTATLEDNGGHVIKYDLDGNYEWDIELVGTSNNVSQSRSK